MGVLVINLFLMSIFSDQVISPTEAYNVVTFKQEIKPASPVETYEEIEESVEEVERTPIEEDLIIGGCNFRILVDLQGRNPSEPLTVGPILTFKGKGAYPESRVLLEFNSGEFFVSISSDSEGNWSWTNYTHPFKEGLNNIKTYNFSPVVISDSRDIFAQEYSFNVDEEFGRENLVVLDLTNLAGNHSNKEDNDLLKDIVSDRCEGIYFFDSSLLNKRKYLKGETLMIEYIIQSASSRTGDREGKISFEIFKEVGGEYKKVSESEDIVSVTSNNSFLKKIRLKDKMQVGNFFIKSTFDTAGKKYISINSFEVSSEEVVKIGGIVITRDNMTRILLNVIAFLLIVLIITLLTMIYEYRRFLKCGDIGNGDLYNKGYL